MTTEPQPENPDAVGAVDGGDHAGEQHRAAEAQRQASGLPDDPGGPTDPADPMDEALHRLLDGGLAPDDAGDAGDAGTDEPDERTPEELREQLEEASRQLAQAADDDLRLRAEFANFRKRTERDALQGRRSGQADVLGALLDVLDDFDRTIDAAAGSPDDALRSGVVMVRDKLAAALAGQGLVRIAEVGVPFDPNHHEAIQKVEAEDGPLEQERVQQVFRPGYLHGDRVLRAAMVVVEE